jgi:hypothetical protein
VSATGREFCASQLSRSFCGITGLISQVAQTLWEVKDKKIMDLTKQDITIVEYKKQLAKRSESTLAMRLLNASVFIGWLSLTWFLRFQFNRSSSD